MTNKVHPDDPLAKAERDELQHLINDYPVWPGDTLSHASMNALGKRGLAVRDQEGDWIPTAAGLDAHERLRQTSA